MIIKSLVIEHYRNYSRLHIDLHDQLTIVTGKNAQGKTNLLESIYVGGFGKSFRTKKDFDLIKFDQDMAKVKIKIQKDNGFQETLEYRIGKPFKKSYWINQVNITKISELIGHLQLVLFFPEDLRLVKESPNERRRFINRELSQMNRSYYLDLVEYVKILNQRNALLKKTRDYQFLKDTIGIWDEQLADKGARITMKRKKFIDDLSVLSSEIHGRMTQNKEKLTLSYSSSFEKIENHAMIKETFMKKLEDNLSIDFKRGFTSVGPHRDDLIIFINGIEAKAFASQGQQRTAALSLKLSEIKLIENETGERPILLLDDVMSELDEYRQKNMIEMLKNVQTIITTTEANNLLSDYKEGALVIQIENGQKIDHLGGNNVKSSL